MHVGSILASRPAPAPQNIKRSREVTRADSTKGLSDEIYHLSVGETRIFEAPEATFQVERKNRRFLVTVLRGTVSHYDGFKDHIHERNEDFQLNVFDHLQVGDQEVFLLDAVKESFKQKLIQLPAGQSLTIGRYGECDLSIPHPKTSRQHCRIFKDFKGLLWVEDGWGKNAKGEATFSKNKTSLWPKGSPPRKLIPGILYSMTAGDRIVINDIEFTIPEIR